MKRRRIRGILFDFDGTLTYPGSIDFDAIKKEMGCPQDRYILEYLEMQAPERRHQLAKILESWEDEAAKTSVPNTGAEACLSTLKQKGMPLSIFTRNSMRSVQIALKKFKSVSEKDIYETYVWANWFFRDSRVSCVDCVNAAALISKKPPNCAKCGLPSARLIKRRFNYLKDEYDDMEEVDHEEI